MLETNLQEKYAKDISKKIEGEVQNYLSEAFSEFPMVSWGDKYQYRREYLDRLLDEFGIEVAKNIEGEIEKIEELSIEEKYAKIIAKKVKKEVEEYLAKSFSEFPMASWGNKYEYQREYLNCLYEEMKLELESKFVWDE